MDPAPRRPGARYGAITTVSAIGIGAPGYLHHGLAALAPFLIAGFALSKSTYGLLIASFSATGALGSPVLGVLADRIGGRRLLAWSFVATMVVAVGVAMAPGLPVVFAAAVLGGLTAAAANPATNTLIGTDVPSARRGLVVGIKQAGGPAGIAAAGAVTPWLATGIGWRFAYASGVILPAIGLGLLAVTRAPRRAAVRAKSSRPDWRTAFGPSIRLLTFNGAAIGVGIGAVLGFVSVYAVEELGMSEAAAGAQLTIIGVFGFVARLGWGAVAGRKGSSAGILAVLSALSAVGSVAAWLSPAIGAWLLVIASMVLGVSAMAWNTVGMLAVVREQSLERAGTASGIVVLGFLAGFSLGPYAFGMLVDATGSYTAGWAMVVASFLVSGLVLTRGRRRAASP